MCLEWCSAVICVHVDIFLLEILALVATILTARTGKEDAKKLSDDFKAACKATDVFRKLLPQGDNPSDHLPVFARIGN